MPAPPLLLLDVDGVLNPYAAAICPDGYAEYEFFAGEEPVRVRPEHGRWLRELATRFELTWATGWGTEANRLLAPLLRLPALPVIEFPPVPFEPRDKLPAVRSFAGDRPLAWLDDALGPEVREWAAERHVPTLLIDVDPAIGLTRQAVDECLGWASDGAGSGRG